MALLLVPIAVILTAYVAYASATMSHAWADAIVRGFTAWIKSIPLIGAAVERLIASGATWIANKLGHVYLGLQKPAVNWLGGLAHYARLVANVSLEWPVDLMRAMRWLVTAEIPHLLKALPNAVTKIVHQTVTRVVHVERTVIRAGKLTPTIIRAAVAGAFPGIALSLPALRWLRKHWRALSALLAASAGAIAYPWGGVGRIERRTLNLGKRLTKVERLLGVTAFAVVLAKVLQVSTRCLRTGNLGKAARRWCGLDGLLVDSLLLDLVAIVSVVSVVEFAKDLRAIEDEAVTVLGAMIREWPS